MPGRRPFIIRTHSRAEPEAVIAELLEGIAPEIEARGYRITSGPTAGCGSSASTAAACCGVATRR